ncbi:hypothetical protein HAX39_25060 [Citrobacter freundii]|nr:hypothetical protein [Citrobacter freundii]
MKKLLFLLVTISFGSLANGINMTESSFIEKYNSKISSSELNESDKEALKIGSFENAGDKQVARASDAGMIIIRDIDGDGVIDAAGVMYSATGGDDSFDKREQAVRDAVIKTVIGDKNFNSDRLLDIKNTTAIKFYGSASTVIKGYTISARQEDMGTQVIAIMKM